MACSFASKLLVRSELLANYIPLFKPQSHCRLVICVYISVSSCFPISLSLWLNDAKSLEITFFAGQRPADPLPEPSQG
jgi:hypothetical protein